ncbi:hypothetical protein ACU4GD_24665 [Cupriavidus basilensis]
MERLYVTRNIVKKGTPFANVQGYSNPQSDELWAKASITMDPAERQEALHRGAEDPDDKWPPGQPVRAGVPHAVPQERQEPRDHRHRPERVVRQRLHREELSTRVRSRQ